MNKEKVLMSIADILLLFLLISVDQYAKFLAVAHLKGQDAIPLIRGVLEFNYLENTGAAFGMLQNQKVFFIFVAVVILGAIAFIIFKLPDKRKYTVIHILLVMIAAGAIGNMIDRIRLNYVVDFIYFVLINFPIFNVADIYVTVATAVLIIMLLFVFKEKDLEFLSFNPDKYRKL